jgi:hypothetical protein
MYLADNSSNPDTRTLISYNGQTPSYVEMLVANGSNWDTVYRRYFAFDNNGVLLEDSVYENNNNVWTILQKYIYGHDQNGNVSSIEVHAEDNNNVWRPFYRDDYAYDGNDRMILASYYYYDDVLSAMYLDSKDSFEYTGNLDFYTKYSSYIWDTASLVWENSSYEIRQLNNQTLPDTIKGYTWDGSAWEQEYLDLYLYTSYGNPISDTFYYFDNGTQDEDPGYVEHYYYEHYWPASVKGIATIDISVYPNPAKDILTVTNGKNISMQLQIINALGQTVKTARSSGKASLNISDLSPGVYWLNVSDSYGNKLQTQTIVKQ